MQVDQPNLVFLPGWGFRASVMKIMSPYFSKYRLHYVDLPELASENINHTLKDFSDTLPENSTLIAWSLGGLLAIHVCALFTHKISKLVLLASAPIFLAAQNWSTRFQSLVCFPSVSRSQRQYFLSHRGEESKDNLLYLFQTDLREEFANLTLPVMALAGDRDAILPISSVVTHCISGAGHGLFYTHTDVVCEHINQFLT